MGIPAGFPYSEEAMVENLITARTDPDPVKGIMLASTTFAFAQTRGLEQAAADTWADRVREALDEGGKAKAVAVRELRDILHAPPHVEGRTRAHARNIRNAYRLNFEA